MANLDLSPTQSSQDGSVVAPTHTSAWAAHAAPVGAAVAHRPVVSQSWGRCLAAGLTRESMRLAPLSLRPDLLADCHTSHPLMRMLPIFRDLLTEAVHDAGCIFAIADSAGALMWVEGHPKIRAGAEQIHFVEGADWSEEAAGTNGPGTALAVGGPVRILGPEHFNEAVSAWSCAAAPIWDPDSGKLLGLLDVTGGNPAASPAMLALIRATICTVESELARQLAVSDLAAYRAQSQVPHLTGGAALVSPGGRVLAASSGLGLTRLSGLVAAEDGSSQLPDGRRLLIEPVGATGYVVARFVETSEHRHPTSLVRMSTLGRDTVVLEVNGKPMTFPPHHSEILVLLALAKDGLTTEGLAAGLSVTPLNPTSIRVDMSRLRTRLGELLTSRPYLLRGSIRTDFDVVADLLAEGRIGDALSAYPGPLLPHSQAPGIVARRAALHSQLSAAVAASYDSHLMTGWLETPWGIGDASVWEALAKLSPEGSPRWSQATARARAIRTDDPTPAS